MQMMNPSGLFVLLAAPLIVAIHLYRRRLPVRRVAGLFLWNEATSFSRRENARYAHTLGSLMRDLVAVCWFAVLACDIQLGNHAPAEGDSDWFRATWNLITGAALSYVLLINWKPADNRTAGQS